MNENETKKEVETEVSKDVVEKVETNSEEKESAGAVVENKTKSKLIPYTISIFVVLLLLGGVLYKLESEGRSSTNFFGSLIEMQQAGAAKAIVNGVEITKADLDLSINQFAQVAASQGVDMTNPAVAADITNQALEVLINTELLRQEAERQGLSVSKEEVDQRMEEIKTEIGDPKVLEERMESLGIDDDRLYEDIASELLIQKLLDKKFAEADIQVTDEEVEAMYESLGGGTEGVPALEEVRDQVVNQIQVTKEQQVVDGLLTELKTVADIEIK